MTKILTCIDGSAYADNICENTAWIANKLKAEISLLHVLRRHSDYEALSDHTGTIGLGARSRLLEKLSNVDEERARLDQQKGNLILDHGEELLTSKTEHKITRLHRRGSLEKTIQELEPEHDIIVIGKRGEHAALESDYLGSNLEKVARSVTKPIFLVSSVLRPIKQFMIAYDGKASKKVVDHVCSSPLLKGLECHFVTIEKTAGETDTKEALTDLRNAGFEVTQKSIQHEHPDDALSSYALENDIDLLAIGAYSHSRIRSIFLGSTTASLIKKCKIPLLLIR